jgi:hypothetical protein
MIDSLQSLTRNPLPAITALNLRANRLQSLAGVEKLVPLERLDLRDNRLVDPMELARLTGIPDIHEIWVEGNPFTRTHKDYRISIFNLFRKAPGYTDDVIIDGSGPSYVERRSLVDRPPIPESIPVVKPQVSEVPTVDVSKPAIIFNPPKEPAVLRKERPTPKAVMSEINTSSTRRRKTPKRRIVDLATSDTPSFPTPVEVQVAKPAGKQPKSPLTNDGNYRISQQPGGQVLLPPTLSTDSQVVSSPEVPRVDTNILTNIPAAYSSNDDASTWKESQDWDAGGEIYRQKIEALRNTVGNSYLSVLSEETWTTSRPTDYSTPNVPSGAAMRTAHTPIHAPQAQAIHSGRTLG